MERITYRITLDTHRNGIQRTLQGFETADKMSRRIAVNLVSGGDTYELPMDHLTAMMYVTTPNATEPSINECTIDGNTIIYDVLPIVEEGITEMQLKLIKTDIAGARSVLASPKFAVEVTESGMNDGGATQTTTFTALEDALAKANGVYDCRLLRVEIDDDCTFRAYYADGTVYENYFFKEALYNGNALLSESWAKGGTGVRVGEETNNSMYFSNVSRSASEDANIVERNLRALLEEAELQSAFTAFSVDFNDGELKYMSTEYTFDVNEDSGGLDYESDGIYDPDELISKAVDDYMEAKTEEINQYMENTSELVGELQNKDAELESKLTTRDLYNGVSALSVTEAGHYYIVGGTDLPENVDAYGYLDVTVHPTEPGKYRKITYTPHNSNNTWQNILIDGVWYGWEKISTQYDLTTNVPELIPFTAKDEMDNYLDTMSDNLVRRTHYTRIVGDAFGHPVFGGGDFLLDGHKNTEEYEWQRLTSYSLDNVPRTYERSRLAGTWGAWVRTDLKGAFTVSGDTLIINFL